MMITTYGSLAFDDDSRKNSRVNSDATFEFKYSEVIDNRHRNSRPVKNKNKWNDSVNVWGMSLEKACNDTRWSIRSFCFVITVSKKMLFSLQTLYEF